MCCYTCLPSDMLYSACDVTMSVVNNLCVSLLESTPDLRPILSLLLLVDTVGCHLARLLGHNPF